MAVFFREDSIKDANEKEAAAADQAVSVADLLDATAELGDLVTEAIDGIAELGDLVASLVSE